MAMSIDSGSSSKKRKRSNSNGKRPYSGPNPFAGSGGARAASSSFPRGAEPGYVDLAAANYALDTTGSITLLNTVAQGAGTSQRIGKRIALKSLQCHGYMFNNTTANVNDAAFLIVYDKRPTGVLPAITDILVSVSPLAFNNDNNSGRFRILKRVDQTLVGSIGNQVGPASAINSDWFLNLKGLPQVFKAAGTGAIGDIDEGAMYLVTVGGNAAGTTAASFTSAFRLRYIDV